MANTLGKQLAALRKEKGYTQKQVAEMLNISNKTLSSWEVGNTMPDLEMLPKIADIYGVSCDELLRENVEPDNAYNGFDNNDYQLSYKEINEPQNNSDNVQTAENRVKKMNAIYAVYILLYIFIIPLTLTSTVFVAFLIFKRASTLILALAFAIVVLALYITGISLNVKTFKLCDDEFLVTNFKRIRYNFALSNLCIILCCFSFALMPGIMLLNGLWSFLFYSPIYLSFIGLVALTFIFADKKHKIRKAQGEDKEIYKKSLKTYRIINAISGGSYCFVLIIIAIVISILCVKSNEIKPYETYNTYTEAIERIQSCSDMKNYEIIKKDFDSENSLVELYLIPKNGNVLSESDVKNDFYNYNYEIKGNTLILRLDYLILDTPDGKVSYYVANPTMLRGGNIVANEDGTYSIYIDKLDSGLSQFFYITIGVILAFVFLSLSILCTIIFVAVYDSKYYKTPRGVALQKTS